MIELVYPVRTKNVSVTGSRCALSCAHCGSHYLQPMTHIRDTSWTDDPMYESLLASGGCNREGAVPLLEHREELKKLKRKYRIVAHTGLFPIGSARLLKGICNVAGFDFPPSDKAIRDVLGLDRTCIDYAESLSEIMKCVPVVPHITVGLLGGWLSGEEEAIGTLASLGVKKAVINVFVPTQGTRLANTVPPTVESVVKLLSEAKDKLGTVYLGCMRPGEPYRSRLDVAALEIADRIVMPSRVAADAVPEANIFYECCAFER